MEGSQHGVFYGKRLRSARKRERLLFDTCQIVACECPLSASDVVRQQERRTGSDAVYQNLEVEKLADRLCFLIFVHQVESGLGLCEFDLHSDARY